MVEIRPILFYKDMLLGHPIIIPQLVNYSIKDLSPGLSQYNFCWSRVNHLGDAPGRVKGVYSRQFVF